MFEPALIFVCLTGNTSTGNTFATPTTSPASTSFHEGIYVNVFKRFSYIRDLCIFKVWLYIGTNDEPNHTTNVELNFPQPILISITLNK